MRFSESATVAAALLLSSSISLAQRMPTPEEVAKQQVTFAKALSQIPAAPQPRDQLGSKLGAGAVKAERVDPMDIAKRYSNAEKKARYSASDLLIFVSFSMPREVISELSKQAKQYGATMVMRGFVDDSMVKTEAIAQQVNPGGATWQINPDAFKTFKVKSVPAFVLAAAGATSILEEGCARPASYVSVSGNQSVDVALQTIRRRSANQMLAAEADRRLRTGNGSITR